MGTKNGNYDNFYPICSCNGMKASNYFQEDESYICIYSGRDEDCILFYHAGGIDIGNVEEKAELLKIPTMGCDAETSKQYISNDLLKSILKHLKPSKIE